jgi:hypothetical protein
MLVLPLGKKKGQAGLPDLDQNNAPPDAVPCPRGEEATSSQAA